MANCESDPKTGRFVRKHGFAHPGNATYNIWFGMKARCTKPSHKSYDRYGGRGIRVCDEWEDFENFLRDMGERPDGMTLGRIDNDGPYAPWNCRWESIQEQQNNRCSSVYLEAFGRRQTVMQWARECGIARDTLARRLKLGWSVEKALTTPLRQQTRWSEFVALDPADAPLLACQSGTSAESRT